MNRIRVLPSIILGWLFMINVYHIQAQENLIINLNDGTEQTFRLSEIRKLAFQNGSLWLNRLSGEESSFHYSEVRTITFSNETTGISNSLTGEQNVYIFVDPSTKNVQIRNIAKGTTAVVYGLDGMKIFQDQVSETGYLDTDRLIPGIYLLKIDHHETDYFIIRNLCVVYTKYTGARKDVCTSLRQNNPRSSPVSSRQYDICK